MDDKSKHQTEQSKTVPEASTDVKAEAKPDAGQEWPKPSAELMQRVEEAYASDTVYPPREQLFTALEMCPLSRVKVVILGQDCYHGHGQAHGLAFSVLGGFIPPSLRNIFAELKSDLGIDRARGDLSDWAAQGVLLLNCILSVRAGEPASHAELGWQAYTDQLISLVSQNQKQEHVVFLLWGNYAKAKSHLIDRRHLILRAGHPSPLSVRYFQNCHHFSQTNAWLQRHGLEPIRW